MADTVNFAFERIRNTDPAKAFAYHGSFTVASPPAAGVSQQSDIGYCSNGDAGDPCLAVYDGSTWKNSDGTALSAT